MTKPRFTVVTATALPPLSGECIDSWGSADGTTAGVVIVVQKYNIERLSGELGGPFVTVSVPDYLGVVPAFKLGVDLALQITAPDGIIACLHDDVLIEDPQWMAKVQSFFNINAKCGLAGFGGGTGLGAHDIYKSPYDPMQLARQDFVSNMREAEAHGRRSTVPVKVACLDGFSQIGRAAYWRGEHYGGVPERDLTFAPLTELEEAGVVHHAYDAYLGGIANSRGWDVWMLPIRCHHYGGQTAVGDAEYQKWANAQNSCEEDGDAKFWVRSHRKVYDLLRGVLPLRIQQ